MQSSIQRHSSVLKLHVNLSQLVTGSVSGQPWNWVLVIELYLRLLAYIEYNVGWRGIIYVRFLGGSILGSGMMGREFR